ncbi:MAG: thiolase domain-containing protein [Desulfurococcales archaeon]|nr:thiolase domain-containing protein [Desulfurococcales archaeon]
MSKVYVVSVGMTKVGKFYDRSIRDLAAEAVFKALDGAGNEKPDAIVVGNMLSSLAEQENLASLIADHTGLRGISGFKVEGACGSGGAAFLAGYSLVASGIFKKVLVVGIEKLSERPTPATSRGLAWAADADYELVHGISFAGLNALVMRYYMNKHNVSREEMAAWPVLMHENALQNPYAQLKKRITIEDVLKSPIIADPVRLYDASPLSDGAAAVLLASEDMARKLSDTPIYVAGVGNALDSTDLTSRYELDRLLASRLSAERAFKMAGVSSKDIDVAEIHDAYGVTAAISLEELGFAPRGKGAKLVYEGRFRVGDKPVVNPSGGLKARGHPVGATGIYQIVEIAMQLRGDFPGIKAGGEIGLTQNFGGVGSNVTTVILRR